MTTCSTSNWQRRLNWTQTLSKLHAEGGPRRDSIDWLLRRHGRRLRAELRPGTEIMSRLDSELFPESVFVMTVCDRAPSWKAGGSNRGIRLFSRIGLASSF